MANNTQDGHTLHTPFVPCDKNLFEDVLLKAKDFALSNGAVLRTKENPDSAETVTHAPFMLFPSPVPRSCFQQARSVQRSYNLLMHRIAYDHEFLKECLESTIKVDEYTRNIWNVYDAVRKEGKPLDVSLGMNRSDYMFHYEHGPDGEIKFHLKQIEFNTMASSFGGLSQRLTELHRFVLGECGNYEYLKNIPDNTATDGLAEAVIKAWEQYGEEKAVVVFLVYPTERNIYDQRWLEYAIRKKQPKVRVIRRSIQDFADRGSLNDQRRLIIDNEEVAIVYQRSGYTPNDFHGEKDWDARLLMERSRAIVCPSAAYHLAGTKKVQQVLAQPGVVEKYISDPVQAALIRDTFANLYSMDMGPEGDSSIQLAIDSPDQFVLKPQREGGGNNTFGDDIPVLLNKIKDTTERTAYILMQRIHPATLQNYPIIAGRETELASLGSEIGIFGTLVGTRDEILLNDQQGHILRTKTLGTDEGGVATGYAALDSPYLV